MFYQQPNKYLRKAKYEKIDIDKINNQKIANKVQVYVNNEINKVVETEAGMNAYHNGETYNNPNTLKELISINKTKIDKEYSKLITDKKTSDTLYHQIQVQNKANEKTLQISKAQKEQLEDNIKSVKKVLSQYEVNVDKYKELNKKYPKTQSRKGIITESIANKNYISALGYNIKPHFDGYKELGAMTEALHRQAQNEASKDLAEAQNEEAAANGEDLPNTHKTWIWTGAGATTRHMSNDGQTVPIDEKFIITNDVTGEVDEMDYPLDPTVYSSNTFICYCEVEYHNKGDEAKFELTPEMIQALDSAITDINNKLGNTDAVYNQHVNIGSLEADVSLSENIPDNHNGLATKLIDEYSKITELPYLPVEASYQVLNEHFKIESVNKLNQLKNKVETNKKPSVNDIVELVQKQIETWQVAEPNIIQMTPQLQSNKEKFENQEKAENVITETTETVKHALDDYLEQELKILQEQALKENNLIKEQVVEQDNNNLHENMNVIENNNLKGVRDEIKFDLESIKNDIENIQKNQNDSNRLKADAKNIGVTIKDRIIRDSNLSDAEIESFCELSDNAKRIIEDKIQKGNYDSLEEQFIRVEKDKIPDARIIRKAKDLEAGKRIHFQYSTNYAQGKGTISYLKRFEPVKPKKKIIDKFLKKKPFTEKEIEHLANNVGELRYLMEMLDQAVIEHNYRPVGLKDATKMYGREPLNSKFSEYDEMIRDWVAGSHGRINRCYDHMLEYGEQSAIEAYGERWVNHAKQVQELNKTVIPKGYTSYRGNTGSPHILDNLIGDSVGKTQYENGMRFELSMDLCTSITEAGGDGFSGLSWSTGEVHNVLITMLHPPETNGNYLDNKSQIPSETELIKNRGAQMQLLLFDKENGTFLAWECYD